MSKSAKAIVNLIISAVALVCVITLSIGVAFGWFAKNGTANANGMQVSISSDFVDIHADIDGKIISVGADKPSSDMAHVPNGFSGKLSPGCSGVIEFYSYHPSLSSYNFTYDISVKNNEFAENGGFFADVDDTAKERALTYFNSHLMFFTSKSEDGVYSGRIVPGESQSVAVNGTEIAPYPVKIYWIWIKWYDDVFSENSSVIEKEERAKIAEYYTSTENISKMFYGGNNTEQAYNEADDLIGITLKRVCFSLNVQGS